MRRVVASISMMAVATAALAAGTAAATANSKRSVQPPVQGRPTELAPHAPGEVIVSYKEDVGRRARAGVRSVAGARLKSDIPAFDTQVLSLPAQASVEATVARLNADPRVDFAEPNYRLDLAYTPDDPSFTELWGFQNTGQAHGISDPPPSTFAGTNDADADVPEAWDTEQGENSTVIAVVDSGVDVTHPDLDDNLWRNPGESGNGKETNGLDDDANGKVDDVYGWDTAGNDNILIEDPSIVGYDHGTHVAGTIAAEDNSEGVVGVCPNCKIMVLKFMKPIDTDGDEVPDTVSGLTSDELEAYAYAKQKGASIVNGSFGSYGFSLAQRKAIAGLQKNGILAVYAASNSAGDNDLSISNRSGAPISPGYPASYTLPNIVSVAASSSDERFGYFTGCASERPRHACAFTNYGQQSVDLAAPGVDIFSTLPGNTYGHFNGTSMASPFVAGVAGLVKSYMPLLTPVQIKNAIMRGVDKPASLRKLDAWVISTNGYEGKWVLTNGRVNADKALDMATSAAGVKNFPKTDGNVDGAVGMAGMVSGSAGWGPAGDVNDVYKKKLIRGVQYKVVLDGAKGNTDGCCSLDVIVYRPGTKEIYQWGKALRGGFVKDSNDEAFTVTAKETGMHYIQVNSFLSDKFGYELSVKAI